MEMGTKGLANDDDGVAVRGDGLMLAFVCSDVHDVWQDDAQLKHPQTRDGRAPPHAQARVPRLPQILQNQQQPHHTHDRHTPNLQIQAENTEPRVEQ